MPRTMMRVTRVATDEGVETLRVEGRLTHETVEELRMACEAVLSEQRSLHLEIAELLILNVAGMLQCPIYDHSAGMNTHFYPGTVGDTVGFLQNFHLAPGRAQRHRAGSDWSTGPWRGSSRFLRGVLRCGQANLSRLVF